MPERLSKTVIDAAQPDPSRTCYLFDDKLSGFALKITSAGRKVFVFNYRDAAGRKRRYTIGKYGPLTPTQARKRAEMLAGKVAAGEDPQGAKIAARRTAESARNDGIRTVGDLWREWERYTRDEKRNKRETLLQAKRLYDEYVRPRIGHKLVEEVTQADVEKLKSAMAGTPVQANRVRALVSAMLNRAEKLGCRPLGSNPVRHVERFDERSYAAEGTDLAAADLERLLKALAQLDTTYPAECDVVRMLLWTGCRRGEILRLTWADVDLQERRLLLRDTKRQRGRRRDDIEPVELSETAMGLLIRRRAQCAGTGYVFRNKAGRPLFGCAAEPRKRKDGKEPRGPREWEALYPVWKIIREKAELPKLRIHDLRHTWARIAVRQRIPLTVIQRHLRHSSVVVTEKYAKAARDVVITAVDEVSRAIEQMSTEREAKRATA